jgi:hypothetical protein
MKKLKVGTNDIPSVVKKKVTAAAMSVSSTEAFPTARLALQLEVPTAAAASIQLEEECCNSDLDGRLEAVAASIQLEEVATNIQLEVAVVTNIQPEAAVVAMLETLFMASRVLGPYDNHIT